MIHPSIKEGMVLLKIKIPIEDLPKDFPYTLATKHDGSTQFAPVPSSTAAQNHHYIDRRIKSILNTNGFHSKALRTSSQSLHFVIYADSRRARTRGDIFPEFFKDFFEPLGFKRIDHAPTDYSRYHEDLRHFYDEDITIVDNHRKEMERLHFLYDFSIDNVLQQYKNPSGISHADMRQMEGVDRRIQYRSTVGLDYNEMTRSILSRTNGKTFFYNMKRSLFVGARVALVTPELYSTLEVPVKVQEIIAKKIPEEFFTRFHLYTKAPLNLRHYTIRMFHAEFSHPVSTTGLEANASDVKAHSESLSDLSEEDYWKHFKFYAMARRRSHETRFTHFDAGYNFFMTHAPTLAIMFSPTNITPKPLSSFL